MVSMDMDQASSTLRKRRRGGRKGFTKQVRIKACSGTLPNQLSHDHVITG